MRHTLDDLRPLVMGLSWLLFLCLLVRGWERDAALLALSGLASLLATVSMVRECWFLSGDDD